MGKLILTRGIHRKVRVYLKSGETLEIQPLEIRGQQVRLSFEGPKDVFIVEREEISTKGEAIGQVEHGEAARAAREDRQGDVQDEAPPERLFPDQEA